MAQASAAEAVADGSEGGEWAGWKTGRRSRLARGTQEASFLTSTWTLPRSVKSHLLCALAQGYCPARCSLGDMEYCLYSMAVHSEDIQMNQ